MRARLAAAWWRFTSPWTISPDFTDAELGASPRLPPPEPTNNGRALVRVGPRMLGRHAAVSLQRNDDALAECTTHVLKGCEPR
jgi:hypothetical protein